MWEPQLCAPSQSFPDSSNGDCATPLMALFTVRTALETALTAGALGTVLQGSPSDPAEIVPPKKVSL